MLNENYHLYLSIEELRNKLIIKEQNIVENIQKLEDSQTNIQHYLLSNQALKNHVKKFSDLNLKLNSKINFLENDLNSSKNNFKEQEEILKSCRLDQSQLMIQKIKLEDSNKKVSFELDDSKLKYQQLLSSLESKNNEILVFKKEKDNFLLSLNDKDHEISLLKTNLNSAREQISDFQSSKSNISTDQINELKNKVDSLESELKAEKLHTSSLNFQNLNLKNQIDFFENKIKKLSNESNILKQKELKNDSLLTLKSEEISSLKLDQEQLLSALKTNLKENSNLSQTLGKYLTINSPFKPNVSTTNNELDHDNYLVVEDQISEFKQNGTKCLFANLDTQQASTLNLIQVIFQFFCYFFVNFSYPS